MRPFSSNHFIMRNQNQANIFFAGNLGQHVKRLVLRFWIFNTTSIWIIFLTAWKIDSRKSK